jgi:hypothetical protein
MKWTILLAAALSALLVFTSSASAERCVGKPAKPKYEKSFTIEGEANLKGCKGEQIRMEMIHITNSGSRVVIGAYLWPRIASDNHDIWGRFGCRKYAGWDKTFFVRLKIMNRNAGWLRLADSSTAMNVCKKG